MLWYYQVFEFTKILLFYWQYLYLTKYVTCQIAIPLGARRWWIKFNFPTISSERFESVNNLYWVQDIIISDNICSKNILIKPSICAKDSSYLRTLREVAPEMELFLENHEQYIKIGIESKLYIDYNQVFHFYIVIYLNVIENLIIDIIHFKWPNSGCSFGRL